MDCSLSHYVVNLKIIWLTFLYSALQTSSSVVVRCNSSVVDDSDDIVLKTIIALVVLKSFFFFFCKSQIVVFSVTKSALTLIWIN